ncbi:protein of unknown function [Bartonella clarridgeiae 73]|uniref:Uncharacterized protein n=1 Tax=Bartonella clarridgeiae (strain CCUG 45776 / CIP 104772 / 73) TaxID=696125 RepID=E6YJA3_BARC7|nr:protein of unknown function [Bartonella clarridgeiae 73]
MDLFLVRTIFAGSVPKCLIYIFASCILQWAYGLGANMIQANVIELTGDFNTTLIETIWLVGALYGTQCKYCNHVDQDSLSIWPTKFC